MVNQSLIDYFKQNKGKYSIEMLRQSSIQAGYSAADVDEAIRISNYDNVPAAPAKEKTGFFQKAGDLLIKGITSEARASSKDEVVASKLQEIMINLGYELKRSSAMFDWHYFFYKAPSNSKLKKIEIRISRTGTIFGLGTNSIRVRIIVVKRNIFNLIFDVFKKDLLFSFNADQFIGDDLMPKPGLENQLMIYLKGVNAA